jgi:hypothetical protein
MSISPWQWIRGGDFSSYGRRCLRAAFLRKLAAFAEADVIHWPPDREPENHRTTVMAVIGLEDLIAAALHAQVDADLTIPMASLTGIAVLKLFAWHDRQTNDKDTLDSVSEKSLFARANRNMQPTIHPSASAVATSRRKLMRAPFLLSCPQPFSVSEKSQPIHRSHCASVAS